MAAGGTGLRAGYGSSVDSAKQVGGMGLWGGAGLGGMVGKGVGIVMGQGGWRGRGYEGGKRDREAWGRRKEGLGLNWAAEEEGE